MCNFFVVLTMDFSCLLVLRVKLNKSEDGQTVSSNKAVEALSSLIESETQAGKQSSQLFVSCLLHELLIDSMVYPQR